MNKGVSCLLVGDSKVGKTCMVRSYTQNEFPNEYKPTLLDNYKASVDTTLCRVNLEITDISGTHELDSIRKAMIMGADVAIICYSMLDSNSLASAKDFWHKEILSVADYLPILLVGTQKDEAGNTEEITKKAEEVTTEIKACKNLTCSALTQEGLKKVFDSAIKIVIEETTSELRPKKKCEIF